MAEQLDLSSAYLSALEHGRRGRPTPGLVMEICGILGLIWDEAEDLKRLATMSHPKVVVDTGGLSPSVTLLAHEFAESLGLLTDEDIGRIRAVLTESRMRRM
jgi:transcriptional regulator with XRE-family HTH domain